MSNKDDSNPQDLENIKVICFGNKIIIKANDNKNNVEVSLDKNQTERLINLLLMAREMSISNQIVLSHD